MHLFYKQYGQQGPAIFILHGIFGMLDNWHNIARTLSEHYTVYTIDARNHGQSPHSDEMSYELMAQDVIQLADDLHLPEFILMGHSMGGKTAMVTAQLYPDRVEELIVVDIAPKAYKPGHHAYFRAFEEIPFHTFTSRREIDEALMAYEENAGVRLFLAKNIERSDAGNFSVKSNIPAIRKAYEEIIGALQFHHVYQGRTCFISGENSRYLTEEDKPYILQHFPAATFEIVPNAGHWVHADNTVGFLRVLEHFLSRRS